MGAGSFPAGQGVAGFDPGYIPPSVAQSTLPVAIQYDPATRTYPMNADGTFVPVHPIDQQVAMLLTIAANKIPSQINVGMKFAARVARIAPSKVEAIANDEVSNVLAPLISNNDVELLSVSVDLSTPKQVFLIVNYVNLRLPTLDPRNPRLSAVQVTVKAT